MKLVILLMAIFTYGCCPSCDDNSKYSIEMKCYSGGTLVYDKIIQDYQVQRGGLTVINQLDGTQIVVTADCVPEKISK
jgi:hypothetical protein